MLALQLLAGGRAGGTDDDILAGRGRVGRQGYQGDTTTPKRTHPEVLPLAVEEQALQLEVVALRELVGGLHLIDAQLLRVVRAAAHVLQPLHLIALPLGLHACLFDRVDLLQLRLP